MSHPTTSDGGTKLSNSLKERLKRCGRYHSSPKLTPTRDCISSIPSSSHKNNTPVRKRALSSPLLCGKQKRRQILHSLEYEKETTDTTSEAEPNPSTPGIDCAKLDLNNTADGDKLVSDNTTIIDDRIVDDQSIGIQVDTTNIEEKHSHSEVCSVTENDPKLLSQADKSSPSNGTQITEETESNSDQLNKELKEKEEILRQLKMVQMYRSKNDLDQLQSLIDKWRGVVQQALPDLHTEMTGEPKPSLTQLIDHLGIEHSFIEYDPEEETFG